MKYCFTLLLILCFSAQSWANPTDERKFNLTGTVVDKDSRKPLEYATITVLGSDQKPISGAVTDTEGKFSIRINEGSYTVRTHFISYVSQEKEIALQADLDMGTIVLEPEAIELDDVSIVDEKTMVEFDLDKKVYNIGKDITAQGGTINDVLENVPSVSVSVDGAISLRGSGGAQILINGKPSVLTANNGLASIPAGAVEKVEVVTTPSARYQAAGTAGIINIVLKKNRLSGFSGTVQAIGGVPTSNTGALSLNYKNEKINLFGSARRYYANYFGFSNTNQSSLLNGVPTLLEQIGDQERNDNGYSYFLGADINLNDKNTLTTSFFRNSLRNTDFTQLDYNYDRGLGVVDSTTRRTIDYYEPQDYRQLEVSYTKTFDKPGQKWTVDFQYDFWNDDENEQIFNSINGPLVQSESNFRTRDIESSDDFLLQTDYVLPVGEKGRFEAGIRGETRVISSEYTAEVQNQEVWNIYQGLDNNVDYSERIGGAYAQYGNEKGKFSYLLGLRSEYTAIAVTDVAGTFDFEKDYLRFFPTGHFNYRFSDQTKMQLAYSRRIRRPGFWQLNPFGGLADNNAIRIGNPDLDPAFSHLFELSLLRNFKKLTFNPSLYYQMTNNFFQFYTSALPEGGFVSQPINLDREHRMGIELLANYQMAKWLQLNGEFNYFQFQQLGQFETQDFDFTNDSWEAELGLRSRLPKKFMVQANFGYESRNRNAQSLNKAVYGLNAGISKRFLKDKATVNFNVRNALNSQIQRTVTTGDGFEINRERAWIGRRYSLSFLYQFNRKGNERDRRPGQSNR